MSSMHGHLCIMECRKRGTPVASATSKFACFRMSARLQDHCNSSVSSSRLLSARRRDKETQSRQKLPLLLTSPEGAHKRPPMQGVLAAGRQNKAAGPTRSWSMPSTRGFPVCAHSRATPQTGRSGLRAASRDDALPLTRPKLVCACLPFSLDHAPLPREHADSRDSATMSF